MAQPIFTKFSGPTNTRGSRVIAKCDAGRVSVPWDHALDSEGNHKVAVAKLLIKLGWTDRTFVGGSDKSGGYVFVDSNPRYSPAVTVQSGKLK